MTGKILAVFFGGAIGSVLRYLLYLLIENKIYWEKFWATFTVNVSGSFIIGIVWAILSTQKNAQPWQLLLMTGFLGGFTTFSAFSLDILELYKNGDIKQALIFITASLICSIAAVFMGYYLTRFLQ